MCTHWGSNPAPSCSPSTTRRCPFLEDVIILTAQEQPMNVSPALNLLCVCKLIWTTRLLELSLRRGFSFKHVSRLCCRTHPHRLIYVWSSMDGCEKPPFCTDGIFKRATHTSHATSPLTVSKSARHTLLTHAKQYFHNAHRSL